MYHCCRLRDYSDTSSLTDCVIINFATDAHQPSFSGLLRHAGRSIVDTTTMRKSVSVSDATEVTFVYTLEGYIHVHIWRLHMSECYYLYTKETVTKFHK